MPKILFIQPTQYGVDDRLCKQKKIFLPGLVFPLLSAMTPANWDVDVKIEVVDKINYDEPVDIVGIGTMGYTIFRALEIAKEFKNRGRLVVLGGYMASIMASEAQKYVDSVLIGDAEICYPRMLKDYEEKGSIEPFYQDKIENLKNLPLPDYHHLTSKKIGNMLPVQAARGCPYSCSFCSISCMYQGKYFPRPVEEVKRDILEVKRLGFKQFYLIDDNIIGNPSYFKELCHAIKPIGMKWSTQCSLLLADNQELLDLARQSGAEMMSFGVESNTQEGINRLNKSWLDVSKHTKRINAIAKTGILVSTEMMVGTDSDTVQSIRDIYDFVMDSQIPIPRFYILTPMPGSQLYLEFKQENRLITEDYRLYDGSQAVFQPKGLSPEELTDEYWKLNQKVFSIFSILFRTLLNRHFFMNPKIYLFSFIVNLHYRRYVRKRIPPNIF